MFESTLINSYLAVRLGGIIQKKLSWGWAMNNTIFSFVFSPSLGAKYELILIYRKRSIVLTWKLIRALLSSCDMSYNWRDYYFQSFFKLQWCEFKVDYFYIIIVSTSDACVFGFKNSRISPAFENALHREVKNLKSCSFLVQLLFNFWSKDQLKKEGPDPNKGSNQQ